MVGVQRTIIRQCDALDRLQEMYLEIRVLANTFPNFLEEPQTSFALDFDEIYKYELPALVDLEGNDEPEVYIGYVES